MYRSVTVYLKVRNNFLMFQRWLINGNGRVRKLYARNMKWLNSGNIIFVQSHVKHFWSQNFVFQNIWIFPSHWIRHGDYFKWGFSMSNILQNNPFCNFPEHFFLASKIGLENRIYKYFIVWWLNVERVQVLEEWYFKGSFNFNTKVEIRFFTFSSSDLHPSQLWNFH